MILSNKEKNGKLCNTKSGRSRCAFLGGFGGIPPKKIFVFNMVLLDF